MKLENEMVKVRVNEKAITDCESLKQTLDSSNSSSSIGSNNSSNNGDSDGKESGNSSDSGTIQDSADGDECQDGVKIRDGVLVKDIQRGTYSHGLGLRDDDIILSLNDQPVKSAAFVVVFVQRVIDSSKTGKLRMEIYRKEKGLIVLDNGGNDLCSLDDHELTRIHCTTNRMKSVRFRGKYLIVKSGDTITLSKFRTPQEDKLFILRHYVPSILSGEPEKLIVTMQHKTSGKYLWVENEKISLKDPPPADGPTLPGNSNYLFDVINAELSDNNTKTFQPVNCSEQALGFKRPTSSAKLMDATKKKTFFEIFTVKDHC
ncbi:uncharacterized protein LOC114528178 isoform X2 [Dendronephthya gigantea]|nr:uncharacterized protein LOC114528178 isoform X2 [Dendronephthya gigantea]XP_028405591.1 uncharacterized protein LOC114528178 isoform X2 [Dendronephthya gigantea]